MPAGRVMVTGAAGLLGQKIIDVFKRESEYELHACDLSGGIDGYFSLDITDRQRVLDVVRAISPSVIINAAAFTDVDRAEVDRELAYKVNATAVDYLAEAAFLFGAKMVHISTDYVFNGLKGNYDENSVPDPISYYGKSKLAGENLLRARLENHAILRTQVLYGFGKSIKKNFVLWVLEKLSNKEKFSVVTDQIGNPTLADELAIAVLKVVQRDAKGLYNVSGVQSLSRFDFAKAVAEVFGIDPSGMSPTTTDRLNQRARRPTNSSFICLKAQTELGLTVPSVRDSLYFMRQQMKVAGVFQPATKTIS